MTWVAWTSAHWQELSSGGKLAVSPWLTHPRLAGFYPIDIATPEGQSLDWGLSLTDGSRIHVHEFSDGTLVAHRDRFDPQRGLGPMLAHLLTETFVGPLVGAIVLFAVIRGSERA